jgi:hypothetical protein
MRTSTMIPLELIIQKKVMTFNNSKRSVPSRSICIIILVVIGQAQKNTNRKSMILCCRMYDFLMSDWSLLVKKLSPMMMIDTTLKPMRVMRNHNLFIILCTGCSIWTINLVRRKLLFKNICTFGLSYWVSNGEKGEDDWECVVYFSPFFCGVEGKFQSDK